MIRIATVDDETEFLGYLAVQIEDYMAARGCKYELKQYSVPQDVLTDNEPFDLYLIDIDMPGINGLELAQTIRDRMGTRPDMMFVTSDDGAVFEVFRYHVFDYIMKTDFHKRFINVMDRYLQEKKPHNRYTFELKDGIMVQYADDIVYAEALGHSVTLHCISGDYQLAVTLKNVAGILAKERFLRVHKSFLVNTDYIRKLDKTSLTLSVWDDRQLPISKNNAYNIRQDFLRIQGSEDIM